MASTLRAFAEEPATGRCANGIIETDAESASEHDLACFAATDALALLARCHISPRRPVRVHIAGEVRHPFGGPIFGLFDKKQETVLVTRRANLPALVKGTPYAALPQVDFYRSVIVHEVVHGVLHQSLKRPPATHAGYEYPAYALQIESLPSAAREMFLRSFDQAAMKSEIIFADSILFFDPFYFAARAYEHFTRSRDKCAALRALLDGEAAFIASPM
jgi:hypothetical protein